QKARRPGGDRSQRARRIRPPPAARHAAAGLDYPPMLFESSPKWRLSVTLYGTVWPQHNERSRRNAMRVVLLTQDEPLFLGPSVDYLLSRTPAGVNVVGCVVFDPSPL